MIEVNLDGRGGHVLPVTMPQRRAAREHSIGSRTMCQPMYKLCLLFPVFLRSSLGKSGTTFVVYAN